MLFTAPQAQRRAARAAHSLQHRGLVAGDRIGVITPEYSPGDVAHLQADTVALVWAALRLGVVPVMIHPLLTPTELRHIVDDAGLTGRLFGPTDIAGLIAGSTTDLADRPLTRAMHYTSGTTGVPKGVTADLSAAAAAQWWDDEIDHWGFTADDVTLVHSPLCHSAPLRFAIGTLEAGGTVALTGRFDAARTARALAELRPTTAFVVPSQLQALLNQGVPDSPYRLLAHAGSACPAGLKQRVHAWAGAQHVWEFYGATEGQFTSCRGTEWELRPGTVGRARAGRVLQVDDRGQIWCAPPDFARFEYWNDPDKTAAAWGGSPGGAAFTVGDLGRLDPDGYLFLEGRREDLIISGGVNVYPAEVEGAIIDHPGVTDVAVFPVVDHRWGQRVACAVVGDVGPAELQAWAKQRLAGFKVPKDWIIVAELPRNSMGKVSRTALAAALGLE